VFPCLLPVGNLDTVSSPRDSRLRVAAIGFLNPAPLMWDFDHAPHAAELAARYQVDSMMPSECADRLAGGQADIGLVPIAALATVPGLRILPGCAIASKGRVRSLLLVHRAARPLAALRGVAADTASRTTLAYARILFHFYGNPSVPFIPMAADLDAMLDRADAAILIGDPALLALEERANRVERTGEELVYLDLAEEWNAVMDVPFVSAVWGAAPGLEMKSAPGLASETADPIVEDLIRSRDHGLANIDSLVREWSKKLPLSEQTIQSYLTSNIHYVLDDECIEGMRVFFQKAAECGALPDFHFAALNVAG
jgi:chorismate dehydratase